MPIATPRRYVERQGPMLKGTEKIWDFVDRQYRHFSWPCRPTATGSAPISRVYHPSAGETDIENVAVVAPVLEQAGIDLNGFADFSKARQRAGMTPCRRAPPRAALTASRPTVFDRHDPVWREHLPFGFRWHLQGRKGQAPDIAYADDDMEPVSC